MVIRKHGAIESLNISFKTQPEVEFVCQHNHNKLCRKWCLAVHCIHNLLSQDIQYKMTITNTLQIFSHYFTENSLLYRFMLNWINFPQYSLQTRVWGKANSWRQDQGWDKEFLCKLGHLGHGALSVVLPPLQQDRSMRSCKNQSADKPKWLEINNKDGHLPLDRMDSNIRHL